MPVLLEEKRIFFSSAEKEASEIAVVARNCSIVYCFDGRPGDAAQNGADAPRARPASPKRRRNIIGGSFSSGRFYPAATGPPRARDRAGRQCFNTFRQRE